MNPTHHANTILEISDLRKEYPGFRLNHVSFSLNRGSIMGLVGATVPEKRQPSNPCSG